jgi:nucleoid-associated protein YgaU
MVLGAIESAASSAVSAVAGAAESLLGGGGGDSILGGLVNAYLKLLTPGTTDALASEATGAISDNASATFTQGAAITDTLYFAFNPKTLSYTKTAQWSRTASASAPQAASVQWKGAGPRKISIEVLIDDSTSSDGDVTAAAEFLFSLLVPTSDSISGGTGASAPYVLFGWGKQIPLVAVATSVTVNYNMFHVYGTPYRAIATVALEEVDVGLPKQNPTSGSLVRTRSRRVRPGDSLPLIAHQEWRNPFAWRRIAEANGIDDPLRLPAGTEILVPDRDDS